MHSEPPPLRVFDRVHVQCPSGVSPKNFTSDHIGSDFSQFIFLLIILYFLRAVTEIFNILQNASLKLKGWLLVVHHNPKSGVFNCTCSLTSEEKIHVTKWRMSSKHSLFCYALLLCALPLLGPTVMGGLQFENPCLTLNQPTCEVKPLGNAHLLFVLSPRHPSTSHRPSADVLYPKSVEEYRLPSLSFLFFAS